MAVLRGEKFFQKNQLLRNPFYRLVRIRGKGKEYDESI